MSETEHAATIDRVTTRRSLLAAAAGGAAAIAARAAMPAPALAADPNDLVLNIDNPTSADTGVTNGTDDVDAFHANASGTGAGLAGTSASGPGVRAASTGGAGVYATGGDGTDPSPAPVADTGATGVYGFAPTPLDPNQFGVGVWGDSGDVGVQGTAGAVGVYGEGNYGVYGAGYLSGGAGVVGQAVDANTFGVIAQGDNSTRTALRVTGKASFSRSGRTAMAAGTYYKTIYLTGVSTSSLVFAVLTANRSGRWVRAVVPVTGRFVVYLNTTLTATTYVAWWVIN
jgi:hypothetical protein